MSNSEESSAGLMHEKSLVSICFCFAFYEINNFDGDVIGLLLGLCVRFVGNTFSLHLIIFRS